VKSKREKTRHNVAKSSKEGSGSKSSVLPMMMIYNLLALSLTI
jgi:hypothetical protein